MKILFILSPPYCGSTLLTELLETSKNISLNNSIATKEGQQLPELNDILFNDPDRWNINKEYDWSYISKIWFKYWDVTKPVLVEKSPPNLIRAKILESYFKPSYFIIMVRNPYTHCEGLMRRNNWDAKTAANFAIDCLLYQKFNIESLKNILFIRYEDLVENTTNKLLEIKSYISELSDLVIKSSFKAHNYKRESLGLINLNEEKIINFLKKI